MNKSSACPNLFYASFGRKDLLFYDMKVLKPTASCRGESLPTYTVVNNIPRRVDRNTFFFTLPASIHVACLADYRTRTIFKPIIFQFQMLPKLCCSKTSPSTAAPVTLPSLRWYTGEFFPPFRRHY